jgi:hypothetical protein
MTSSSFKTRLSLIFVLIFAAWASLLLFSVVKAFADDEIDDVIKNAHPGKPSDTNCPKTGQCAHVVKADDKPQTRILNNCNGGPGPGTAFCTHVVKDNDEDKQKNDDTKFFRGHNNEIKEIPMIPQMNFATTTNGTTANVTIPICNGVVGGPCLDPNTHTIIP